MYLYQTKICPFIKGSISIPLLILLFLFQTSAFASEPEPSDPLQESYNFGEKTGRFIRGVIDSIRGKDSPDESENDVSEKKVV